MPETVVLPMRTQIRFTFWERIVLLFIGVCIHEITTSVQLDTAHTETLSDKTTIPRWRDRHAPLRKLSEDAGA